MTGSPSRPPRFLFGRGSWPEARRIGDVLRAETVGGALLLGAAVLALVWANSPWSQAYQDLSAVRVGPHAWHLTRRTEAALGDPASSASGREYCDTEVNALRRSPTASRAGP